jgi:hypothetical protein
LAALATGDQPALEANSSPSLEVIGFWYPSVPDRLRCGNRTGGAPAELAARVADGLTRTKILECVAGDPVLVGSIPHYPPSQWPSDRSAPDSKRRAGYLKLLDLRALPPRLERYRDALSAGGQESVALTFFVTDTSGLTAYGAILVRDVEGSARVASVFIDQKFEE